MTRQTFKSLAAALLLSAVAVSPASQAYFTVSLPGNAMTMSGVEHAGRTMEPERERTAAAEVALPVTRRAQPEPQAPPSRLRAAAAWLRALVH